MSFTISASLKSGVVLQVNVHDEEGAKYLLEALRLYAESQGLPKPTAKKDRIEEWEG